MMSAVLLAEDTEGTLSLCDMDTGGRHSQALRGGVGPVSARGVARLGNDFVVAAYKEKPVLHVWTWTKHAQPVIRIPLPGKALAVSCSPCGTFCVCGIGSSMYIWEVGSGRLLAVVSLHFQPISVLCFTDDGSHVFSGGHDGVVHVWSLSGVLSQCHRGEAPTPLVSWKDHSRPVTDIYCGIGGLSARVYTAAKDGTCQIYELSSQQRVCTIIFESGLVALALCLVEMHLFGAEEEGHIIRKVNLYSTDLRGSVPQKAMVEVDGNEEESKPKSPKMVCTGHTGSVTCLSMCPDGTTLVSASTDGTARLWQVSTCECLLVIQRQGPISFASFTPLPPSLYNRQPGARAKSEYLPPLALFQRQMSTTTATSSSVAALETCTLRLDGQVQGIPSLSLQGTARRDYWKSFMWTCSKAEEKKKREAADTEAIMSSPLVQGLKHQLTEMRKVNRQLLKDEARDVLAVVSCLPSGPT